MEVICITHNWMRWCQNFSFVVVLWWLMARPKGWGLHGNGTLRSFQSVAFAAPSKPSLIFKTSGNRSFASLEKRRTEVRTSNEVISHRSSFIEGKSLLRTLMVDAVAMRIIAYVSSKSKLSSNPAWDMYLLQNVSPSLHVSKNETLLSKRFIRRRFCKPPEKRSTFLHFSYDPPIYLTFTLLPLLFQSFYLFAGTKLRHPWSSKNKEFWPVILC